MKSQAHRGDIPTRREQRTIYDSRAGAKLYELWGRLTESRAHARALEVAEAAPGESVLEVAVGTGVLFSKLLGTKDLKRCVGVELAPGMLLRAQRRLAQHPEPRAALCRADARCLPFPAASFDLILNAYMLDLLSAEDIPEALKEFRRTLKPTGRLVVLVMARQGRLLQGIWDWLYARSPALVGGCRRVAMEEFLLAGGWRIAWQEQISQSGFRSDLFLARPG